MIHKDHRDQLSKITINYPLPIKKNHGNVRSNHQKWLPYQTLGGKTIKSVQIDPQTTCRDMADTV